MLKYFRTSSRLQKLYTVPTHIYQAYATYVRLIQDIFQAEDVKKGFQDNNKIIVFAFANTFGVLAFVGMPHFV